MLAEPPEWKSLEVYQGTISRHDFEFLLTSVFTTGEAWRGFIQIDDNGARILTGSDAEPEFLLRFAVPGNEAPIPRHWRTIAELPPAPQGMPLAGLKIAIDPGHIGGRWAKMEERWFVVGEGPPVCEGDMTLTVARLLKPELEKLGATVSLVRDKEEPVTPLRPEALQSLARESAVADESPAALRRTAELLFYRTAEIRARAERVNHLLEPDLVLCLHFNADPWGDPLRPTLVERSHLHLLLNGAYTDDEVSLADQRFALLEKLLQRTHHEEVAVGASVAETFAAASGLPPYQYPPQGGNALPIPGQPYLWARNLLANRLYDCPVIFLEPYVMNSTIDYPRLEAGDFTGKREIGGTPRISIFREYADAVAAGLANHYQHDRKIR